jgi:two-component system phosphate regulon sensor histidine kinase PhoR
MGRRIFYITILMTICSVLLLSFQLYWNYQAYKTTYSSFNGDVNEALRVATDSDKNARINKMVSQYQSWLADSSNVLISWKRQKGNKEITFVVRDSSSKMISKHPFVMSVIDNGQNNADSYRKMFIDAFTNNFITKDIRAGVVYYYTQRLGNLLESSFSQDKANVYRIKQVYAAELKKRGLAMTFNLYITNKQRPSSADKNISSYLNIKLQEPNQYIFAKFSPPGLLVFQRLKWGLFTSILLISITLFCFGYILKTFFKQKQISELKNDFINNMTHELKTPVATISVAAEAIENFDINAEVSKEYVNIIRNQANNLSVLIEEILKSVVREESTKLHLDKRITINDVLKNVIQQFQPQILAKNVKIELEVVRENLNVKGSRIHLSNVFANLLDNAIKYSFANPVISINLSERNSYAIITITNNGHGIPSSYKTTIFERFVRIPSGNIHNVKGYGLGLSYSKDIIIQHGGTIELISTDTSNMFVVKLPLSKSENA